MSSEPFIFYYYFTVWWFLCFIDSRRHCACEREESVLKRKEEKRKKKKKKKIKERKKAIAKKKEKAITRTRRSLRMSGATTCHFSKWKVNLSNIAEIVIKEFFTFKSSFFPFSFFLWFQSLSSDPFPCESHDGQEAAVSISEAAAAARGAVELGCFVQGPV